MKSSRARWWRLTAVIAVLALASGQARSQVPRTIIYVGPLYPKSHASDNGIPGTGNYAYNHYHWPTLGEALREYGWFGKKIHSPNQVGFWNTVYPPPPVRVPIPSSEPPAPQLLPAPRKY